MFFSQFQVFVFSRFYVIINSLKHFWRYMKEVPPSGKTNCCNTSLCLRYSPSCYTSFFCKRWNSHSDTNIRRSGNNRCLRRTRWHNYYDLWWRLLSDSPAVAGALWAVWPLRLAYDDRKIGKCPAADLCKAGCLERSVWQGQTWAAKPLRVSL